MNVHSNNSAPKLPTDGEDWSKPAAMATTTMSVSYFYHFTHRRSNVLLPTSTYKGITHSPIVPSKQEKTNGTVAQAVSSKLAANPTKAKSKRAPSKSKKKPAKKAVSKADKAKHIMKEIPLNRDKQPTRRNKLKRPRAKWTGMEDDRMMRVIEKLLGPGYSKLDLKVNWADVASIMKTGRKAKQCRDRWMNYLRPGLKKGDWQSSEEDLIKDMYEKFGPKWSAMTKMLPNRAENDIKNKWYSMMRKQKRCEERVAADLNYWANRPDYDDEDAMDVELIDEDVDLLDIEEEEDDAAIVKVNVPVRGKQLNKLLAAKDQSTESV